MVDRSCMQPGNSGSKVTEKILMLMFGCYYDHTIFINYTFLTVLVSLSILSPSIVLLLENFLRSTFLVHPDLDFLLTEYTFAAFNILKNRFEIRLKQWVLFLKNSTAQSIDIGQVDALKHRCLYGRRNRWSNFWVFCESNMITSSKWSKHELVWFLISSSLIVRKTKFWESLLLHNTYCCNFLIFVLLVQITKQLEPYCAN